MNPDKNLSKKISSMTENQTTSDKILEKCSDLQKENEELNQLAETMSEMVINLRKENSNINDQVNKLKQEKQEFEDQEKNRSEISEQLIQEAQIVFQHAKHTIQKSKHDNP